MMHRLLAALALLAAPAIVAAEVPSDVVSGTLRPGWRTADGTHVAALELRLAPGWKTYWRAPGDAGIPPLFDWSGSSGLRGVNVTWPVPHVFRQSGMRSIGYSDRVVLPLTVATDGGDARLDGEVEIGVCHDVCLPATLKVSGTLDATTTTPDPVIAAALATRPFTATEAGVSAVRCTVAPEADGLALTAEIAMPRLGADEETMIETANPAVWVSEPETRRSGDRLVTETRLVHVDGRAFALDRSGVRITVMANGQAVDIKGCNG
ncbi:protein-disulfide reductase DsbD domain-containing protein [Roseivivax marinus]|uniref:protein-disulfide reductase DsbD domain-containing protein n=1 Tax=Roseivivax marinus TaxID=1379903 RepID=UPI00273D2698|nr:protein-disulfide reductase DsbD domain-containing protein [Roseivivax marinus]